MTATVQPALDGSIPEASVAEFWKHVTKEGNCWLWQGDTFGDYGTMKIEGNSVRAHRLSWRIANRCDIPAGMVVRHTCDTPLCVRPDHLLIGTYAQNQRDAFERNRYANHPWPAGEAHWHAVLDVQTVNEMRRSARQGATITAIAEQCGIPYNTAYNAIRGITWASASEAPILPTRKKRKKPHWNRSDLKNPELFRQAIELRDRGFSIQQIVIELGISRAAASRWCRTGTRGNQS